MCDTVLKGDYSENGQCKVGYLNNSRIDFSGCDECVILCVLNSIIAG